MRWRQNFFYDGNRFRANLIADCDVGYFVLVGWPTAARVIRAGVYPIKGGQRRRSVRRRGKLQQHMASNPPPWLAKLMGAKEEERIRCQALVAH